MEVEKKLKILDPWETVQGVAQGWTLGDAAWVLIAVGLAYVIYKWSTIARRLFQPTWMKAILWLVSIVAWLFVFITVLWKFISISPISSLLSLIGTTAASVLVTSIALRKAKIYERVLSAAVKSILIFGALAAFGLGQQPIGLAVISGTLLGFFIGGLLVCVHLINREPVEEPEDRKEEPISEEEEVYVDVVDRM